MQNRSTPFRLPAGFPGLALLGFALLCAAPPAAAQFDAYTWTLVDPDVGTPDNFVLGDHMHIEGTPGGFGHVNTYFVTTAPETGTFAVDLDSNFNAAFGIGAYTIRNGVKTPICKNCETSTTLDVEAGDIFGFGFEAVDFTIANVDYTNLVFTAAPVVTSITSTHAWLVEDVVITGSGFGAQTTVDIDGVPEPVLSWTPTELVIAPAPHAPGFASVRVTNAGLAPVTVPNGLAFLPTLLASGGELGGTLSVEIDSGAPGAFLLVFGLNDLPAPLPAANAYFGLLLDPASLLGVSVAGALSGSAPVQLDFPLPELAVLAGVPLHMQVLAAQGGAPGGVAASFSNHVLRVLVWPEVSVLHVLSKPEPAHADDFGKALAALGDVDGDGVPDFVVGANGADVVTVHSGTDGAVLLTLPFPNVVVAGLADFDGDGVPEIGIGNGTFFTSSVLICSGATGAILREHTAPEGHMLGASLAALGDVNLDGTPDYVTGAPRSGCSISSRSYARVFSGLDGTHLHEFVANSCHKLGTSVGAAEDKAFKSPTLPGFAAARHGPTPPNQLSSRRSPLRTPTRGLILSAWR